MRYTIALALSVCLVPFVDAAESQEVGRNLADAIQRQLPAGWSVERDGQQLVVTRDEPIEYYNRINLPGHTGVDDLRRQGFIHKMQYALTLRLGQRIAPDAHRRLAAENAATGNLMESMRQRMRHISHKFDSYLPDGPDEEKLVAEYKRLKSTLHDLPGLFDDRHSVWVSESLGWACAFASDGVGKECRTARDSVLARFHSYRP